MEIPPYPPSDDAPEEPALYRAFLLKSLEQLGERIDVIEDNVYELRNAESASMRAKQALDLARRQSLLARMAGNIAGGMVSTRLAMDDVTEEARNEYVATHSVDIAERILKRIGL